MTRLEKTIMLIMAASLALSVACGNNDAGRAFGTLFTLCFLALCVIVGYYFLRELF